MIYIIILHIHVCSCTVTHTYLHFLSSPLSHLSLPSSPPPPLSLSHTHTPVLLFLSPTLLRSAIIMENKPHPHQHSTSWTHQPGQLVLHACCILLNKQNVGVVKGCGLSLSQASARRTTPHTLVCSSLTATVEMCIFLMRDHFQVILRPWSVNHVLKVHTNKKVYNN